MALAIMKVKIMPESPSTDREKIKKEITERCNQKGAILHKIEEEPIAFGLVAVIPMIGWPEEKNQDEIESTLKEIPEISSVEIIDYRRAFG